jgi:ADP-glucose pyrophosphorylase
VNASRMAALVLVGGEGSRVRPLTNDHPTLVPPVGGCLSIDAGLSNPRNPGVRSTFVLLQHELQCEWHGVSPNALGACG